MTRQKYDKPESKKVNNQNLGLWDFQEPQDGEVGHVGEVGHGHGQVVLHTHLVETDRFQTLSLILKPYLILIILLLILLRI